MKSFRFKLQSALDFKVRQEEQARMQLAKRQQALDEAQQALNQILLSMAQAEEQARQNVDNAFNVEWRKLFGQYWRRLLIKRDQAERLVEERAGQLLEARQALIHAMRERKVLENLREKHLLEYKQELAKAEQQILDEIALNRFIRANDTFD